MQGLPADVNVQGHLPLLLHVLEALDLRVVFDPLGLRFVTNGASCETWVRLASLNLDAFVASAVVTVN